MPEPEFDQPADEAGDSADDSAGESSVDWSALPEPLRVRLAELGADALGEMAKVDVPQHLRPVAKFAPTKRARLGGSQVVAGLRDSANFRTAVVEWLRKNRPSTLEVTSPDPVTAAAARWALDHGARHVVLYTDLANPTTNRLYPRLGFRPRYDAVELRFVAPERTGDAVPS